MAFNKFLIALTCAVLLPSAALAQTPAWSLAAAKADCCATATDADTALARSVLMPAQLILPVQETATALAASVLLPAATDQSIVAMVGCCNHEAAASEAKPAAAGCDQKMTEGGCCKEACGMPCSHSVPPTR